MSRSVLFAEVPGFYASVERADHPDLARRPVVVGGDPRKRGLVQAATSEALAAGVRIDMPMLEALRLCPSARRIQTDMNRYREVSRRLFAVLRRGFQRLEPFGLGAAFFEVTGSSDRSDALAHALRERVRAELSLPLRVGMASNKFLARLAAEEAGDEGVHRVPAGEEQRFLRPLPVTRLDGVGQKTAAKLAELGARAIGDVAALDRDRLEESLGSHGLRIRALALGHDERPVRSARHPQSLSREVTIRDETLDLAALVEQLQGLAQRLDDELRLQGLCAAKVVLKLRFEDQGRATRSRTLSGPTAAATDIQRVVVELLERTQAGSRPVRGLGIQLAGLAPVGEEERQLDLFS